MECTYAAIKKIKITPANRATVKFKAMSERAAVL